ncbi:MAG: sulfatase [Gemmatimonadetes bacterium]|nr:sulfatase [Gemmatimonadota bacterium]
MSPGKGGGEPPRRSWLRPPPPGAWSPGWTLLLALWGGLVAGLLEASPLMLAERVGMPLRLSHHFVWMIPIADTVLFLAVALAIVAVGRLWPTTPARRLSFGAFAGLGALCLLLVVESIHDAAAVVLSAGVGVQASRMAGGRLARALLRLVPATTGLALLLVGALAGRAFAGERSAELRALAALPAADAGAPNVLLLILDTVRAASVGLHGAAGSPTPRLDAFASRGVVFDRAIAPSPWTLPSHASFFTGRWPFELSASWVSPLDTSAATLAEALAAEGYATAGFVGNLLYASRETGLARGFARYDDYPVSAGQVVVSSSVGRALAYNTGLRRLARHHQLLNRKHAADVAADFTRWLAALRRREGGRPFFAFLNFFDAHEPIFPADSLLDGLDWNAYTHLGGILTGANAWRDDKWRMSPREVAVQAAAYRDAVAALDRQVGALLDRLEETGALDNTVVIVASDHGEQIGEHRLFGHNNSLYLPSLHVPLAVVAPGRVPAGLRVAGAVSLRDLPATVLDLVDADATLPGRSLALTWGEPGGGASAAVSYLTRGYVDQPYTPIGRGREMQSVVEMPYHYIRNGDGTDELYDLVADPHQRTNLAGRAPATDSALTALRGDLFRILTGREPPDGAPVTPAEPLFPDR